MKLFFTFALLASLTTSAFAAPKVECNFVSSASERNEPVRRLSYRLEENENGTYRLLLSSFTKKWEGTKEVTDAVLSAEMKCAFAEGIAYCEERLKETLAIRGFQPVHTFSIAREMNQWIQDGKAVTHEGVNILYAHGMPLEVPARMIDRQGEASESTVAYNDGRLGVDHAPPSTCHVAL